MLRCRETADRLAHDADEIVAGEVRCWHAVLRVIGVDGIREAIGEHLPVTTVDRHRVLDDSLADRGAVFELTNSGFESGGQSTNPFFAFPVRGQGLRPDAHPP